MKNNKEIRIIWIVFWVYFLLYLTICLVIKEQQFLWLLLETLSIGISIFLLIKTKFSVKKIRLPILFTVLYLLSTIYNFNMIGAVLGGIVVFLSSCAVISTYKSIMGKDFPWIRHEKRFDIIVSVGIGIVVGVIWGGINYMLMKGSNMYAPANIGKAALVSLNPAINEEIASRSIFYVFCIYFIKGKPTTKKQSFICWFMMIVPHILPHILFSLENGLVNSLMNLLVTLLLYILIFGFIFAYLQRKRDVLSAMIAHGLVDAIRFSIFGLPF